MSGSGRCGELWPLTAKACPVLWDGRHTTGSWSDALCLESNLTGSSAMRRQRSDDQRERCRGVCHGVEVLNFRWDSVDTLELLNETRSLILFLEYYSTNTRMNVVGLTSILGLTGDWRMRENTRNKERLFERTQVFPLDLLNTLTVNLVTQTQQLSL